MDSSLDSMLIRHLEHNLRANLLIRSAPMTGKTQAIHAARQWASLHPHFDLVCFAAHHTPFAKMHKQLLHTAEYVQNRHTVFVIDDIHLLDTYQLECMAMAAKKSSQVSVIGLGLPVEPLADACRSSALFDLINEYRAASGLSTQQRIPALDQEALRHTLYMAHQLEMTHRGEHGSSPAERVLRVLPEAKHIRECVARGLAAPHEILEQWLGSRNHYNNIRVTETNACGLAQVWRWTVSRESGSPQMIAHVFVTYITCSTGE
ncbi:MULTISPECIES: CAP domain-containing protein [Pseudomonas]|uniref:CAP domain-containing protein n=1 Tax=Pseudomonas aphyarum TaxID=2942629 RepID=A0ABT5PSZ3_9PSED|nr:CAP domain-containing protein [Pseudomonas aphyarum]MDD0969005.1 CAP domain-containing protein [Pseudomonas aphyarum]MDD1126844.1 CAP domain-containing protein [Pseudomonas aphyarum]